MKTLTLKRGARLQAALIAALGLAAFYLMGCRSPVYQKGDRAADSAQVAAVQVQTELQALAGTLTTLSNLVKHPAADLRPAFLSFDAALDSLIATARRGDLAAYHLARSNDVFFASWDRQLTTISNLDIRARSAARRNESSNEFRTINDRYVQAREQLRSLILYLEDIRRALSTDLTPNGIEAIKPLVANASTTAANVKSSLSEANNNLAASSVQMSSSRGLTTR